MALRLQYEFDPAAIRARRYFLGFRTGDVAKLADVPKKTWKNIETGDAIPSVKKLCRMCAALSMSPGEVFKEIKLNG
jgi:transcriptional regulator with XRE-family HTH domain